MLRVALLPPNPANLRNCHTLHSEALEGTFDLFEFVRSDNTLQLFHIAPLLVDLENVVFLTKRAAITSRRTSSQPVQTRACLPVLRRNVRAATRVKASPRHPRAVVPQFHGGARVRQSLLRWHRVRRRCRTHETSRLRAWQKRY